MFIVWFCYCILPIKNKKNLWISVNVFHFNEEFMYKSGGRLGHQNQVLYKIISKRKLVKPLCFWNYFTIYVDNNIKNHDLDMIDWLHLVSSCLLFQFNSNLNRLRNKELKQISTFNRFLCSFFLNCFFQNWANLEFDFPGHRLEKGKKKHFFKNRKQKKEWNETFIK